MYLLIVIKTNVKLIIVSMVSYTSQYSVISVLYRKTKYFQWILTSIILTLMSKVTLQLNWIHSFAAKFSSRMKFICLLFCVNFYQGSHWVAKSSLVMLFNWIFKGFQCLDHYWNYYKIGSLEEKKIKSCLYVPYSSIIYAIQNNSLKESFR